MSKFDLVNKYEKEMIKALGYDKNLVRQICTDVCDYFKDRSTDIHEFDLEEFIFDRLKEDNLIGFTTDFVIAVLIRDNILVETAKDKSSNRIFRLVQR